METQREVKDMPVLDRWSNTCEQHFFNMCTI